MSNKILKCNCAEMKKGIRGESWECPCHGLTNGDEAWLEILDDIPTYEDLKAENKELRKLLWLRHGCPIPALYGDDGEMQCSKCKIDFKLDSAKAIGKRWHDLGVKQYAESLRKVFKISEGEND